MSKILRINPDSKEKDHEYQLEQNDLTCWVYQFYTPHRLQSLLILEISYLTRMILMFTKVLTLSLALVSFNAFAGFKGDVSFNEQEIKTHVESMTTLTTEAEQCLKQDLNRHQEFFKKYGISAFYGDNSDYAKLSEKRKRKFLKARNIDPNLVNEITGTSCVGLTLKCLERGFKASNQEATFKKLKSFVFANDVDGTALQYGLSKLGWKTLYWNPDPSKNKTWDFQEKMYDPFNLKHIRGFHEDNYYSAIRNKRYYMNTVIDVTTLVGFENSEPAMLKSIPFFVGTAHMGYHVFSGAYGIVVEGHASRAITDESTIESAAFNPLDSNGAPKGRYRSGMISIPPTL